MMGDSSTYLLALLHLNVVCLIRRPGRQVAPTTSSPCGHDSLLVAAALLRMRFSLDYLSLLLHLLHPQLITFCYASLAAVALFKGQSPSHDTSSSPSSGLLLLPRCIRLLHASAPYQGSCYPSFRLFFWLSYPPFRHQIMDRTSCY